MAIPSGSGTEVLKRASLHAVTNSYQAIITGTANHIYTILSVIFCEQGEAAELINMRVDVSASGSNQIRLLEQQTIGVFGTFVFNDKFVLSGTDKLEVGTDGPANVDVYVSYIDQDWS